MKTIITFLSSILIIFSVAGNATAEYTYGAQSTLGLSSYNPVTGVERGYNLGLGIDLASEHNGTDLGSIDVTDTDATLALYSSTSNWQSFFGLTTDIATGISGSNLVGFQGACREIFQRYNFYGGSSPIEISASDPKSANSLFVNYGSYMGAVSGGNPSLQPSLESLATEDFFDIFLYQYDGTTLNKGFDTTTDFAAVLRIASNGNVTLNSAVGPAVPIPAAIWLLGPGLIGIIGIRRRRA